jgi:RNA polymerase sigma-70 factor (ECF subfamily)
MGARGAIHTIQDETHASRLESALRVERVRLVRWCAYLTGDLAVAEDLVQETSAAAWRSSGRPDRAEEYGAWLAGIARNICRSWRRSKQREMSCASWPSVGQADDAHDAGDLLLEATDVTELVEQKELARLLDHAMGYLPAETRQALVARYIEGQPLAQVAARMGLSASALAARLHRGKQALRHVLATELRDEAAPYGLVPAEDDGWRETRIWCPVCGARRFEGRLTPETDTFALRCPQCYVRDQVDFARWSGRGLFRGLSSHRAALSRLSRSAHEFYARSLRDGIAVCVRCGATGVMRRASSEESGSDFYLRVVCARCAATYLATLSGILFCHPQAQRFWRDHPRMMTLPDRAIEYGGQRTALTSFVSRDGAARLDFISDPQTFAILHSNGPVSVD